MNETNAILTHLSTQSRNNGGIIYNFRSFEEVEIFLKKICCKYKGYKPISVRWFGCCEVSRDGFMQDLRNISEIYSKQSGVLLKGVVINIPKAELENNYIEKVDKIIISMAQYYLFQGYIVGTLLFDMGTIYECFILINPVSYYDGGKLQFNRSNVLEEENECLRCAVSDAVNGNSITSSYDYSYLPAYPL